MLARLNHGCSTTREEPGTDGPKTLDIKPGEKKKALREILSVADKVEHRRTNTMLVRHWRPQVACCLQRTWKLCVDSHKTPDTVTGDALSSLGTSGSAPGVGDVRALNAVLP